MESEFVFERALRDRLKKLRLGSSKRAIVCSAFCRAEAFEEICCDYGTTLPDQRLLVRWRLGDLVYGASDVATYYVAKEYGWSCYLNLDLHAKCFVFDDNCLITSANMTESGFPAGAGGNIEMGLVGLVDERLCGWIEETFRNSVLLNDDIVNQITRDVQDAREAGLKGEATYSADTLGMFYSGVGEGEMFTWDFPWCQSPKELGDHSYALENRRDSEHDLLLFRLGRPLDREELRNGFLRSKCWRWLIVSLHGERYFGELARKLHEDLADDPAPFRKDVKILLHNLLEWALALVPDLIGVDRPNYSQRAWRRF